MVVMLDDGLVDPFFYSINGFYILLDVEPDLLYSLRKCFNETVLFSDGFLCTHPLIENVIIAFIFLQLQRLVHHLEIIVNLLNLLPIKLFRQNQVLFYRTFFIRNVARHQR